MMGALASNPSSPKPGHVIAKTTMRRTILYSTATAAPSRLANDDGKRRGASGAPGTAAITKDKPQTKRPSL
jgi:hypothetical protein